MLIPAFIEVGGYDNVTYRYFNSPPEVTRLHLQGDNSSNTAQYWECGLMPDRAFHFFKPHDDPDLPWTGITMGLTISAVWYWCSDQVTDHTTTSAQLSPLTHSLFF